MKSLYHKNKDKVRVYPSSSPNNNKDVLTSLLPAAILVLVSLLSLEDREVLSYLITMSTNVKNKTTSHDHNKPLFDCGCFDCYTSFWSRWDSSPNRELIHQVVEAFEEHLSERHDDELSSSSSKHRAGKKKKDKMGTVRKKQVEKVEPEFEPESLGTITEDSVVLFEADDKKNRKQVFEERKKNEEVKEEQEQETVVAEEIEQQETVAAEEETEEQVPDGGHKGLVLPDLLRILNSRLWSFWSPKV